MEKYNWSQFLVEVSQLITTDESFVTGSNAVTITDEQRATKWLGRPGATEAELAQLEARLQQPLPPSYRAFLASSNGFGPIDYFIYELSSTSEVEWLAVKETFLVDLWEDDPTPPDHPELADEPYLLYDGNQPEGLLRPGHMRQCLLISNWGDAGFLALNPAQQHEGEWEAWHFANWHPGATRYRSFADLLHASVKSYVEIRASAT